MLKTVCAWRLRGMQALRELNILGYVFLEKQEHFNSLRLILFELYENMKTLQEFNHPSNKRENFWIKEI